MNLCYEYSIKWRYEFHNDESGIVTFGETKRIHCQSIKQRNWVLGNEIVDERYEYKSIGVVKITLAHSLLTSKITLTKQGKRQV